MIAWITGTDIGRGTVAVATTLGTERLTDLFLAIGINITLMTFTRIRSRTITIHTFIFAYGRTTMRFGFFITLMALTTTRFTAKAIFTILGAGGFTNATRTITIGMTLEAGTLIGRRTETIHTFVPAHRNTTLRFNAAKVHVALFAFTHIRCLAYPIGATARTHRITLTYRTQA